LYVSGPRRNLSVAQTVRFGQFITAAMLLAVLAFLAVVLVVDLPDQTAGKPADPTHILTYTAAAFALMILMILAVIVPRIDPFIRRTVAS